MLAQLPLLALAAAAVSATPAPNPWPKARVVNNCDVGAYIWAVGGAILGPSPAAPGVGLAYEEVFRKDPVTGGIAIKIALAEDGLYSGDPQLVFAYNLDGDQVWYDLSTVFGDPFAGKKLVVKSEVASCPAIVWPDGVSPGGSQVKVCTAEQDVTLTLCA